MIDQVQQNGELRRAARADRHGGAYLCGPAPVQKSPDKPGSGACLHTPWERSQCGRAISRSDGAVRIYSWGGRFGLTVVRASAPLAKHGGDLSPGPLPCRLYAVCPDRRRAAQRGLDPSHQSHRVKHVVTRRKRPIMMTIEVSLRLRPDPTRARKATGTPQVRVTGSYKAVPKRGPHAVVDGTALPRPVIQRCQQGQSNNPVGLMEFIPRGLRLWMKGLSLGNPPDGSREIIQLVSPRTQAPVGPRSASSLLNPSQAKKQLVPTPLPHPAVAAVFMLVSQPIYAH